MNADEQIALQIKGMVASLSPEMQVEVKQCVDEIKATIHKHGAAGAVAIAVIGSEMAAEAPV